MARFNFRIGTKLGLTAGIGVILVGGMLANQVLGNQSIATTSALVISNYSNRGNAQTADAAMARAELAAMEISQARSVEQIDKSFPIFRENLTVSAAQLEAARQRATRPPIIEGYRAAGASVGDYLTAGTELAAAQKLVLAAASGKDAASKAEDAKKSLVDGRVVPTAREIKARIDKLVIFAGETAAQRQDQLLEQSNQVATIGLVVGVLVVVVLIGSALFSVLTIARPVRRIGEVLLELANGNKAVVIPFTERGDEVGDNARAARTFKDNLIRIERMEADQKNQEAAAAAQRKAEMHKLADAFQAAVGGIVHTGSAASSQREAAAGTLSSTAEQTQQLSGM